MPNEQQIIQCEGAVRYYCDNQAQALEVLASISDSVPHAALHAVVFPDKNDVWQVVCEPTPELPVSEDFGFPEGNAVARSVLLELVDQMLTNEENFRFLAATQASEGIRE